MATQPSEDNTNNMTSPTLPEDNTTKVTSFDDNPATTTPAKDSAVSVTPIRSPSPEDLAAQSSVGTVSSVTSSETISWALSLSDRAQQLSGNGATGDTSRRTLPSISDSLAERLRNDPDQGVFNTPPDEIEEELMRDYSYVGFCLWILTCCCIGKLPRRKRAMVLWLCIVSLATVFSSIIYLNIYTDKTYEVSPTDMRMQGQPFAVFCSAFTVRGNVNLSAYLLDHPPQIDPHNRFLYTTKQAFTFFNALDTVHLRYYLLPGSNVTFRTCMQVAGCVALLIFKGENNYQQWRDGNCLSCDEATYVFDSTDCMSYSYIVPDSDTYYFMFASCQDSEVFGTSYVLVNRSIYDITDAPYACLNTKECVMHPDLNPDLTVVWQTGNFDFHPDGVDYNVSTSCRYRLNTGLLIFGLSPLVLGVILHVLINVVCKYPHATRARPSPELRILPPYSPDERTPLLGREETDKPPEYEYPSPAGTPPPAYEDAWRQGLSHS